jgi:hypothetical protein
MFINVGSYIDATKKGDFEYYALLKRQFGIGHEIRNQLFAGNPLLQESIREITDALVHFIKKKKEFCNEFYSLLLDESSAKLQDTYQIYSTSRK